MDQQTFKGQMDRLAAAYRVEISASTRAAYFLAFQKTSDRQFSAGCERAIEHEKIFPSIAALKEIIKHRHEVAARTEPALAESTGSVACQTCGDAGYVRREVPVTHPQFGAAVPCPHCDGAKKPRNAKEEYRWIMERGRGEPVAVSAEGDGPLRPLVEKIARRLGVDAEQDDITQATAW